MLFPNKVKYRKQQRGGLRKGDTHKGDKISFGEYGIISLDHAWISERQIEAARIAINRYLQRDAKIWIRVFPDKPMTAKGEGVRMGKGKGAPEGWVAVIRPGRVMFEIGGTTEEKAKEAFRLAGHKLSVKTKFVGRVE